jgi:protein-tyrosine-phosphatase
MAEAYARSLLGNTVQISSSGIEADTYPQTYISPFARIPLKEKGLLQYASQSCTLTSQELLDSADVIVFADKSIEEDVTREFNIPSKAVVKTWDVSDIVGIHPLTSYDSLKIETGRERLNQIEGLVDSLLAELKLVKGKSH